VTVAGAPPPDAGAPGPRLHIDPAQLARLGSLTIQARVIVEGALSGLHRAAVHGSSLFGAELAGMLGLPYAFASHFAPQALVDAVALYRRSFRPSVQLDAPYAMAGVNVIAADTDAEAQEQLQITRRARVRRMLTVHDRPVTDTEADAILRSPQAAHIDQMMRYTAAGAAEAVAAYLEEFAVLAGVDELMTVHQAPSLSGRIRSLELTAVAVGVAPPA